MTIPAEESIREEKMIEEQSKSKKEWRDEARALRAQLKEKKRDLRETEERYQRLVGLMPDAVSVVDLKGNILYANPACVDLLGIEDKQELEGRSFGEFIRHDDRGQALQYLQRLRRGEPLPVKEQILQRQDGRNVPVETAATPIRYNDREAILSTMRDLSGRKAMEQALTDTQRLFYEAFHLGPAALTISRLDDGTFVDVNEEFLELSGYDRSEILGRSVSLLDLWEHEDTYENLSQDLQAHGAVHDVEASIRRKDGTHRTVLASARRLEVRGADCMLTCAVDMTERKRAQRAEKEIQARFRKIFHISPTPICISKLDDGSFIDLNEAYSSMMGYERQALLGEGIIGRRLWEDQKQREQLVNELRTDDVVHDREITLYRQNEEAITLLGSFQRIQVNGENCILSVLSDITRRKEAERALRQAKEDAEAMDQFKTSILENLTHEVRTPMTVILGFVSVLREGVHPDYERFVNLIERSGRRLLLMLDAILDLAQLEAGTLDVSSDPFNVNGVVRAASDTLRPIAEEKGLSFEIDLPIEPIYVRTDHEVLTRILNNLIDNAIKFTDEGQVELFLEREGDDVAIHVCDTGVGIDENYLQELFTEFTQESEGLERTHQGSGLGLAVTKRLVEHMGGSIGVESTKGEGTEFVVTIPRAQRMDAAA